MQSRSDRPRSAFSVLAPGYGFVARESRFYPLLWMWRAPRAGLDVGYLPYWNALYTEAGFGIFFLLRLLHGGHRLRHSFSRAKSVEVDSVVAAWSWQNPQNAPSVSFSRSSPFVSPSGAVASVASPAMRQGLRCSGAPLAIC